MEEKTSFLGKKWILPNNSGENLIENLKKIRGIKESGFHAPNALKDLGKAVERIQGAIKNEERILIIGDYDADGITASVILFKTLSSLRAKVSVRLPHREKHGYGLNAEFVREAKDLDVSLIITVDNGISAHKEIELANSLSIDVIITDHHLPPEKLPPAFAIVNPRRKDCGYPEKNLSGAAVAYKIAIVLAGEQLSRELNDELLALTAIGTLADVCELSGENRAIVTEGLKKIPQVKNIGLQKILQNANLDSTISSEDVGFRIAPRLNAAGRIDDPLLAFQALTSDNGENLADNLEELNSRRQQLTEKLLTKVEEQIEQINTSKILVVSGAGFHLGIIGLAAGKLAEKYHRPAIVMSENNGIATGSCRSPLEDFNITEALSESADLLSKFGGHRAAAGFTLETKNLEKFRKNLTEYAENKVEKVELIPQLELDGKLTEENLSQEFLAELQTLAPFGAGNPDPLFCLKDAEITDIRKVGNNAQHLRAKIGKNKLTAIGFGLGEFAEELGKRNNADIAFQLGENVWNGNRELQLRVVDLR